MEDEWMADGQITITKDNQVGNVLINSKLKRVRVTIVAVEKQ
jgi:hypothetical protein